MKKALIGIVILSGLLFSSCDKENNVAKEISYTFEDEFLDKSKGWKELTDTYIPDKTNPDSLAVAYEFGIMEDENGLYSVKNYANALSDLVIFKDYKTGNFNTNANYVIESALTINGGGSDSRFSGITWNQVDDDNYSFFGLSAEGTYRYSQKIDGSTNTIIDGALLPEGANNTALKIKLSKIDTTLSFIVNDILIDAVGESTLSSNNIGLYSSRGVDVNYHYLRAANQE